MYLKRLTLANYKCFGQKVKDEEGTQDIEYQQFEFSPGLNYFVGNNNSGKTTVLEAISFLRNGVISRGGDEAVKALRFMAPNSQLGKPGELAEDDDGDSAASISSDELIDEETLTELAASINDDECLNDQEDGQENDQEDDEAPLEDGRQYFVEGVFADVTDEVDVLDKANQKKLKDRIDGDEITVRRYFGPHDNAKALLYKGKDGEFSNVSGIDAPFKKIFDPILVESTTMADDVLNFNTTKMLGKLMSNMQEEFEQSDQWKELSRVFNEAFGDENHGYRSYLKNLTDSVTQKLKKQYGDIAISLSFNIPDLSTLIRNGIVTVDDGHLQSALSSKGNGLQRAVALALIQVYAEETRKEALSKASNRKANAGAKVASETDDEAISEENEKTPPLFLCLDEPEVWLHPNAQIKLAEALADISKTEQMWITTHSPYILKAFKGSFIDDGDSLHESRQSKLYIFHDFHSEEDERGERIVPNARLGLLHSGAPSLGEITFEAFQIATPEFHSEVFGLVQELMDVKGPFAVQKTLEDRFYKEGIRPPLRKKKRFNSQSLNPDKNYDSIIEEYLPVYVRNCIDHPESIAQIDKAIARAERGDRRFAEYLDDLRGKVDADGRIVVRAVDNEYQDDLFESTQMLLSIYEHERDWQSCRNADS